tara:strand:+ start:86 stop:460 length:375 start_codon:yes stop_codon:yes gene_type:complete
MENISEPIQEYIKKSNSGWYINFYLKEGVDMERAIRRGMEEHIEELCQEVYHYEKNDKTFRELLDQHNIPYTHLVWTPPEHHYNDILPTDTNTSNIQQSAPENSVINPTIRIKRKVKKRKKDST